MTSELDINLTSSLQYIQILLDICRNCFVLISLVWYSPHNAGHSNVTILNFEFYSRDHSTKLNLCEYLQIYGVSKMVLAGMRIFSGMPQIKNTVQCYCLVSVFGAIPV